MGKIKPVQRSTRSQDFVNSYAATAGQFLRRAKPFMAVLDAKATTDVEKAEQLRAYHRLGKLSLELVSDHGGYGKGVLQEYAKAVQRPYGFLSVARRFAARYSKADLLQFLRQPLSVSHLRGLVDVGNKQQRAKLQKRAYDQQLSVAELLELKKQQFGRKRSGGAPVKIAKAPKIAVLDLLSDGDAWVRRCEATIPTLKAASEKRVPAGVRDVADRGIERLRAIARVARQAEKELRRLAGEA